MTSIFPISLSFSLIDIFHIQFSESVLSNRIFNNECVKWSIKNLSPHRLTRHCSILLPRSVYMRSLFFIDSSV
ncbi:hypothetical protein L2E82_46111 [Cichorium intybus]|uniref:Uncharacterized protein n=1 Tax=Cichorium intybus TaxID=13427 RepID=A0ACB8YRY9_CICIN|nr:hypothetical protein L2E82_46111 [Cichorium intybus]